MILNSEHLMVIAVKQAEETSNINPPEEKPIGKKIMDAGETAVNGVIGAGAALARGVKSLSNPAPVKHIE